ncbi:MAG: spore protease YyaC [Thermoleophilia bacterium]|nr:spore protease YyaC [Thermoleophilia bacterium]
MEQPLVIPKDDPAGLARLSAAVHHELLVRGGPERGVVFACIGTDRSTGDALGPLVGQKLVRLGCATEEVVGTLEDPLHALNLADRLGPVLGADERPVVVAVDAALGPMASVGAVRMRDGGLRPGQGVGKDLPEIGDLSVTATVNIATGLLEAQVLQSTRLWLVQGLADLIGVACWWGLRRARQDHGLLTAARRAAEEARAA